MLTTFSHRFAVSVPRASTPITSTTTFAFATRTKTYHAGGGAFHPGWFGYNMNNATCQGFDVFNITACRVIGRGPLGELRWCRCQDAALFSKNSPYDTNSGVDLIRLLSSKITKPPEDDKMYVDDKKIGESSSDRA